MAGKKTMIYTKISHGEKEIGDPLLSAMARQLRLTRNQLNDLIDCPLQYGDYVKILTDAGVVAAPGG